MTLALVLGVLALLVAPPAPGFADFVEYWSSFQLALAGQNPYDAQALFVLEHSVRPDLQEPIMMWNPPWLHVLLAPILSLDLALSGKVFLLVNLLLYFLSAFLILRALNVRPVHYLWAYLASVWFYPLPDVLNGGQISIFVGLGAALLFHALCGRRSPWQIAFGLCLLSLKPHLFYLLGFAVLLELCCRRHYRALLVSCGLFSLLAAVTQLFFPGNISAWLGALLSPVTAGVSTFSWRPVSLVAPLVDFSRSFLPAEMPIRTIVAYTGISLMVLSCLAVLLVFLRQQAWRWQKDFHVLAAFSCFTSPHAWMVDQVALLPLHLGIFACGLRLLATSRTFGILTAGSVFVYQTLVFLMAMTLLHEPSQFFWYPLGLLLLYTGASAVENRLRTREVPL